MEDFRMAGRDFGLFISNELGANRKQPNNKVFIAYFSATGTTAGAAEKLSKVTGGELYEITPAQPYTNADLNWNNKQSPSSLEIRI